jgi:hypothetical protein
MSQGDSVLDCSAYAGGVLLAAIPQVDVVKDGFDWINLFVGLGGFVAALTAIVLARRAQRTADEAIADERRRVFELEVLRELLKDLRDTEVVGRTMREPNSLQQYRFQLDLLSSKLQFWERTMLQPDTDGVVDAVGLGVEFREARSAKQDAIDERGRTWTKFRAVEDAVGWPASAEAGLRRAGFGNEVINKGTTEWFRLRAELQIRLAELTRTENLADAEMTTLMREASDRLREKLGDHVKQAIWSRVEARRHKRLSWWYRV